VWLTREELVGVNMKIAAHKAGGQAAKRTWRRGGGCRRTSRSTAADPDRLVLWGNRRRGFDRRRILMIRNSMDRRATRQRGRSWLWGIREGGRPISDTDPADREKRVPTEGLKRSRFRVLSPARIGHADCGRASRCPEEGALLMPVAAPPTWFKDHSTSPQGYSVGTTGQVHSRVRS